MRAGIINEHECIVAEKNNANETNISLIRVEKLEIHEILGFVFRESMYVVAKNKDMKNESSLPENISK